MYRIIKNPTDYTLLQADILSLCKWISDNFLTLNYTIYKSCYMLFTRKRHPTLPAIDQYVGDHELLSKVSNFKYLGLNISQDLSWSHHIESVCKKSSQAYRNAVQKFLQKL